MVCQLIKARDCVLCLTKKKKESGGSGVLVSLMVLSRAQGPGSLLCPQHLEQCSEHTRCLDKYLLY